MLPRSIDAAFTSGQFNKVHTLEGSTHDEYSLFVATGLTLAGVPVTPAACPSLIAAILQLPPPVAQQLVPLIVAQYPLAISQHGARAHGGRHRRGLRISTCRRGGLVFQPPLTQRVQLLTPPTPQAYTATAFVADHKCEFWQQVAAAGN